VVCPEGQSFTGFAEKNEEGLDCGTADTPCEKRLTCSNGEEGWKTTDNKICNPKDPNDPCTCEPIKCPEPKLPKNEGTFRNMKLEMTDVIDGVAIYKNTIDMTCAVGYSFYGQMFTCGPEALIENSKQCHTSFECKENGRFMRKHYCETKGATGKDGSLILDGVFLVNIPSGCERIREYCPKLPAVSGFKSDASCLHIAEGGEYEAKCSFACEQVMKQINYQKMQWGSLKKEGEKFTAVTEPRKCLKNSEKLECGKEGKWALLGGAVQEVVTGKEEDIKTVMEGTCLENVDNFQTCDVKKIKDYLRGNFPSDRHVQLQKRVLSMEANTFVTERQRGVFYCGDAIVMRCLGDGFTVEDDDETTLLVFECADTSDLEVGGGKGMVTIPEPMEFRRVSREGKLGKLLSSGEWGCKAKGCGDPQTASWWPGLVQGLYKIVSVEKSSATLRCNLPLPQVTTWQSCMPPKKPSDWEGDTAGELKVDCKGEEWLAPKQEHIDACASQIVNEGGQALSVNENGEVSWANSDVNDLKQRWARYDGRGSGLIISASKPFSQAGERERREVKFSAQCLGVPDAEKVTECWCGNTEDAKDKCKADFALKMKPCTETCDEDCETNHKWALARSTEDKEKCGLTLVGPPDVLYFGVDYECDIPALLPYFFLDGKAAASLTVASNLDMGGQNHKFQPDRGVPVVIFPRAKST